MTDQPDHHNHNGEALSEDTCERYCFNAGLVNALQQKMPHQDAVEKVATFFHALGTRTRVRILFCLSQAEELCVCDIANALGMKLSSVSHQLRHLRSLGVVVYRNEQRMAFYRLADQRVAQLIGDEITRRTQGDDSSCLCALAREE